MMAPSDVSSAVFDESSADDDEEPQGAKVLPIPVDDEPNLYRIPSSVYPTYRSLPFLLSLGSIMVSFWASAVQVFGRGLTWLTPFLALKEKQWKTDRIAANRAINSNSQKRTGHFELLIKNY